MIFNLGSINADHVYRLDKLPAPGETVLTGRHSSGLGGKGANQSVAAALAGASVRHIGCMGPDGQALVEELGGFGVDVRDVRATTTPSAHALVMVDGAGENQIVVFTGANQEQDLDVIKNALSTARPGDWLMLQNETSLQSEAASLADAAGLNVAYSAAPFDLRAIAAVLPHVTLLVVNAVEAVQLSEAMASPVQDLPVRFVLVTKGAQGAEWHDTEAGERLVVPAFAVEPVDSTGAGDTFCGYAVAGLSQGLSPERALVLASAAAAISVTRPGTAAAISRLEEVRAFLDQMPAKGAADPQS